MKTALLVIDVQKGMFQAGNEVHKSEQILDNIVQLIEKARSKDIPLIFIQHNAPAGKPLERGLDLWQIHDSIKPHEQDTVIEKTTPDSFLNTQLESKLKELGVEHLIITGIQSEVCVDTTCRSAFSKSYKVTLVSDAHSTWGTHEITADQIINHHNRTLRWFAQVVPTESIIF